MASIARCLRSARPSGFSLVKSSPIAARVRPFSVSATVLEKRYTKEHEWVDLSADKKTAVIGISEYAAAALGDVVFVELPEVGKAVQAGDPVGAVESVKSAADINSPVSCKVTAVNTLLEEKPGTINQLPEDDSRGGGWVVKAKVDEAGATEFEALMTEEQYGEFTASSEGEDSH
ncbi:glycine cleavage H-protein-domain-containing protein [Apodospora peruviana]|uniref:Glycine cleavage system H protein n=1 Tax=Apodospora peruviana TaxID=516989 RepID=A0AAE0IK08_9PEZI|nr:glycine cleavage H-protein-domain-containing protein [Apodospora peruviana]